MIPGWKLRPGRTSGPFAATLCGESMPPEGQCPEVVAGTQGVPAERRRGRFVTVAAIAMPEGKRFGAGRLGRPDRRRAAGSHGFRYDPVFPAEYHQTLAQLSPEVKTKSAIVPRAFTQARTLLQRMMAEQTSVGA